MCKECDCFYIGTYESRIEIENPTMEALIKIHEQELTKLKTLRDRGASCVRRVEEEGSTCCDPASYHYDVLEPEAAAEFGLEECDLDCYGFVHAILKLNKPIDEGGTCVKQYLFCTRSCRQQALNDPKFMRGIRHFKLEELEEYPRFGCVQCDIEVHERVLDDSESDDSDVE